MFKNLFFIFVFFVVCSSVIKAQPQSILVSKITPIANNLYSFTHNLSDEEYIVSDLSSENRKKQLFDTATEFLREVQKAMVAGLTETRTIAIKKESDNSTAQIPISELKELANRVLKATGGSVAKESAEEAGQYISIWLKPLEEGKINGVQAEVATETGKTALAKLDEARKNGLADTEEISVMGQKMTVADVREQIIYIQSELSKINQNFIAEREAKLAPFRAVLNGDKLSIFNSRFTGKRGVYGIGGKLLRTPAEYASSPVWCEWSEDTNRIVKSWDVACWQFKGMTKVGGPTTKSGFGTPPASAFR